MRDLILEADNYYHLYQCDNLETKNDWTKSGFIVSWLNESVITNQLRKCLSRLIGHIEYQGSNFARTRFRKYTHLIIDSTMKQLSGILWFLMVSYMDD